MILLDEEGSKRAKVNLKQKLATTNSTMKQVAFSVTLNALTDLSSFASTNILLIKFFMITNKKKEV